MATTVSIEDIQNDDLHKNAKLLVSKGYHVGAKKELAPDNTWSQHKYHDKFSFSARKGHVSIRGFSNTYDNNTYYKLFSRNENGGYCIRGYGKFDVIAQKAIDILSAELAPPVPKFKPNELPQPFVFATKLTMDVKCTAYGYSLSGALVDGTAIERRPLVTRAIVVGITSFDDSLYVSEANALDPNKDAWFAVSCQGMQSSFYIISDGEKWYPIRKAAGGSKHRVCLSSKIGQRDIAEMNQDDGKMVKTAIDEFMKNMNKTIGG